MPSLRALRERSDVALVVTQPARPSGRGRHRVPTPVKSAADSLGLATVEPDRLRDLRDRLESERPDLFAVASYGKIIPASILELARLGALNVHPSLLPLYRGATPLQSAIRDGRTESGVTIMLMDAGMDTGDVVLARRTPIGPQETYGELHDRYALLGAELLVRAVDAALAGTLERTPQSQTGVSPQEAAATLTHPLTKDDLFVDWSWPALRVVNVVRSLAPQPLARAPFGGESVKIVAAHVAKPDEVHGDASVACGDGTFVVLERVVPPNRAAMDAAAYLRAKTNA